MQTIVLKFGSSVLRDDTDLPHVVQEIYRWRRRGWRVVAVVSAFAGVTDALVARADTFGVRAPGPRAALIATGEAHSAARLGLALHRAGVPAEVRDAASAGLRTTEGLDARPVDLDPNAFAAPVTVLPGFVGVGTDGRASLLGRGGSDLTALFVAHRLNGRCRLIKDVPGIYDRDPACHVDAQWLPVLSWDQAVQLGAVVVQPKAVAWAQAQRMPFEVSAAGHTQGSRVGPHSANAAPARPRSRPLRVALLGLGTVGLGVYRLLSSAPERFEVTGVLVRHRDRDDGVPPALLCTESEPLLERAGDVVVEVLGGLDPAERLIRSALGRGRTVVTANKAVLAHHPELAVEGGCRLRASAAVGGAVPALEAAARHGAAVHHIEGVVNGTSTSVLEAMAAGKSLARAVADAQALGLAEADPTADLDGRDAAHKLCLLARAAWGLTLDPDDIPRQPIGPDAAGCAQVARVNAQGRASVTLEPLAASHPLAGLTGADNAVALYRADGSAEVLVGTGAGRWPTATAVVADLWDLVA